MSRVRGAEPTGDPPPDGEVRRAAFADLDTATLYAILQLRADVFVVEQRCAYRDLDGRDTESTTQHLWVGDAARAVSAYVRIVDDGDGVTRIGRVVTAPDRRGRGLADRLVRRALADAAGPVLASAQAHLRRWYEARGFAVVGPGYDEDGIPHLPMRHDPPADPRRG